MFLPDDRGYVVSKLFSPGRDSSGRLPQDVVGEFLQSAYRGDVAKARQWWVVEMVGTPRKTFHEYVADFTGFHRAVVSYPDPGKSGSYSLGVDVYADDTGGPRPYLLFVGQIDGEWRISSNIQWRP